MGSNSRIAIAILALLISPSVLFADTAPRGGDGGNTVADHGVKPQDIYSGLVAETLRGLLQQVLVLGLFIVGVGHFTHAARNSTYLRSPIFRRRFVLLAVVMLFVTYMKLTYSVEWALGPESVIREARQTFTDSDRHHAAWMVVLLTPIDLLIVILLAGMFLVLARDEYFGGEDDDDKSLVSELKHLYLLTGGAHAVTLFWWLMYGALTGGSFGRWYDVGYHCLFVILQAVGYLTLKRSAKTAIEHTSKLRRLETIHVAWYSFITVAVYVTRLWIYVFRYTTG